MAEEANRQRFTEMFRLIAEAVAQNDAALRMEILEFARVVVTQGELDKHLEDYH